MNAKKILICSLIIFFLSCFAVTVFAATYGEDWEITKITDGAGTNVITTSLNKGKIAWASDADGDYDIYYWDGSSTQKLTDNTRYDYRCSLYDGTIAWEGASEASIGEIYYWDGNSTQCITSSLGGHKYAPTLEDGQIAFFGHDADYEIFHWDGTSIQKITDNTATDWYQSFHDGKIAWSSDADGDYEIYYWDGSSTQQVSANSMNDGAVSLHNGQIAWVNADEGALYYWDGASVQKVSADGEAEWDKPALYDGSVVWCGSSDGDNEIYFWDGTSIQKITDNTAADDNVALYEGQIAWVSDADGDDEIYLATNTMYYVSSGVEGQMLGYDQSELDALVDFYLLKDEGASVVIGDNRWTYLSGDLPGDFGGTTYDIGDSWIYEGNYYIKLGSGLEGGAVPELPPFAAQGLAMMFAGLGVFLKRKQTCN